ncbi:ATP-binding protein [Acidovorax sp.]|uniref:ATP-binding protein n=1 Tax=Acidovorax sp. TaxID=1872122 RepID=UPI00391EEAF0
MQQEHDFPPCALTGEMAQAIATYEWATHPLGPPASWPASLRNAVVLLLECKLPMYLAWGPQLSQFYNDAYRPILGDKHNGALGTSAKLTWSEIWSTIGPMWDEVLAGNAIGFEDYKLTIQRYGYPEDCYFSFSYSPVRDDAGRIAGVLVTFAETTQKVASERRFRFLDELAQATRNISAPAEVMVTTSRMLGQYLGVNRCAYAHVLDDQNTFDLIGDYNDGVDSIVGQYKFTDFGAAVSELMIANEPYVNPDVDSHPITSGSDLSAYRLTAIQAVICVPLHKNSRFVAAMAVHQSVPRVWTSEEIELVKTVVDRCWESLERVRAEHDKILLLDSERAARKDAERANSVKDSFLATLSHELRTPLSAITGWIHIMRRKLGAEQAELRRGVDVIERSTQAQTKLINDLLDMSRIASGKLRLEKERLDLAQVVQGAHDLIIAHAQSAGLVLNAHIEPVPAVLGDPSRLQQVVWNLFTNAVKFTPQGGSITVHLRQIGKDVVVSVSDTGVGIKKEFLPHLFERFRQADGSITRKFGGLGLGLSIVQHLVELHGGKVTAESAGEGSGATFSLSFPVHEGEFQPSVPTASHDAHELDLSGQLILVVDDDEESRELLERLLLDTQAEVVCVADAYAAMNFLDSRLPDLICSDIGMPGIDGYELMRWLRRRCIEKSVRIPTIAMTAFARSEDRSRSLAAGFDQHLTKPLDPSLVLTTIGELLLCNRRL